MKNKRLSNITNSVFKEKRNISNISENLIKAKTALSENTTIQQKTPTITKSTSPFYSYLLGLYLGDGYINQMPRTLRLRFSLDSRDVETNYNCKKSLERLFPINKISILKNKNKNCNTITLYSNFLINLFPQHGPGEKWTREIKLTDWQKEIIIPEYLILGLIDSDGCLFKVNIGKYCYSFIEFGNKSKDIINIFCQYLDKLRISYRKRIKTKQEYQQIVAIRKKFEVSKILEVYHGFSILLN